MFAVVIYTVQKSENFSFVFATSHALWMYKASKTVQYATTKLFE